MALHSPGDCMSQSPLLVTKCAVRVLPLPQVSPPQVLDDEVGVRDLTTIQLHEGNEALAPELVCEDILILCPSHSQPGLQLQGIGGD